MRKITLLLAGLTMLTVLMTSGIKKVKSSGGIIGYTTSGCNCHNGSKGTVTLSGIPATVKVGQVYTFSLTYNQGVSATYWGLDVKASLGTLAKGTNTNVQLAGGELTHLSPFTSTGTTYTYTGLQWTAPSKVGIAKITYACLGSPYFNGNSDGYYKVNSNSITVVTGVPVEFVSFNAACSGENKINIVWKTATETNSNFFEVERSIDGDNYTTINKVSAAGNSTNITNYSVTDVASALSGVVYYRIKEIDKDGGFTYSEITAVKVNSTKDYVKTVFPNPSIGSQTVHIRYVATANAKVNIELYNCLGRKMNSVTIDVVNGENDLNFNPGHFITSGLYYLTVKNGTEKITQLPLTIQ